LNRRHYLLGEIAMKNFAVSLFAGLSGICLVLLAGVAAAAPGREAAKPQSAAATSKPATAPSPVPASNTAPASNPAPAPVKAAAPAPSDASADEKNSAGAADEPLSDEDELAARRAEIDAHYAEVYRKIAELNLHSALEANRRVPNTVAPAEVNRLRQIVRLAEVQLRAADGSGENSDPSLTIENDTSQVKMTEEALRRTVAANNRAPGVVPQIEVDRLRLLAELGRLQLAKDKAAAEEKKAAGDLRKRVVQLEKQLKDLQVAVERLSERSPAVPAQSTSLAPGRTPAGGKPNKP
jgi:hypothetical protein